MAGRKGRGGIGKAEKVYGNQDVIASAKMSSNKPGAIQKNVGGVVGKKSGGRLDMKARGKSPFSKAGGGSAK